MQKFLTLCFKLFRFPQEDLYFNENQYFCQLPIYPLSSPLLARLFMRMKKGNLLNYSFSSAFSLALEYDKETETILQADDSPSKVRLAEYGELCHWQTCLS